MFLLNVAWLMVETEDLLAVVWSPPPHNEEGETSGPGGLLKVTWLVRAEMGKEFKSSN